MHYVNFEKQEDFVLEANRERRGQRLTEERSRLCCSRDRCRTRFRLDSGRTVLKSLS